MVQDGPTLRLCFQQQEEGGRNGIPIPFKGHTPEVVHITFKNIPLARILSHGHYLAPKKTGKYSLDFERS